MFEWKTGNVEFMKGIFSAIEEFLKKFIKIYETIFETKFYIKFLFSVASSKKRE